MKKILICAIAIILIVVMGITIAVQAVNHKKMVDEQYSWLRSECENAAHFISEYMDTNDEEKYQHAVSRVYGALIMALQIEGDEQIDSLSLELNAAYGNLIQNPDESKQQLLSLGDALWSFGTEGSIGKAEVEINGFNNAVKAMLAEK